MPVIAEKPNVKNEMEKVRNVPDEEDPAGGTALIAGIAFHVGFAAVSSGCRIMWTRFLTDAA